ncbi:NAD(P)-bd-dom domain-containing protein [Mycena chlorophos]|uniref:NAD(P)-bd-dom domain-containing protein n=1 Tax=Mycena chlorophos TaxID=658473 RepID=A0A8H6WLG7_MYCCL|nr:NAD(P)-bd-dom domain-containing protein [Mycena chlorophos]
MSLRFAKNQAAGFVNRIQNVAIVGAGGNIGGSFARHLLAGGRHQLTALSRAGSQAAIPKGIRRVSIDYNDESTLVDALKGQDFLVITLGVAALMDGSNAEAKSISAAAAARVPYVMPNCYGPDPLNEPMTTQMGLASRFLAAKGLVEKLGVSSWVALSCGFWYEWSFVGEGRDRFGIDFERRTVTFFGKGEEKITTSTWDQCGRALAAFLALKRFPEDENDKSPAVDNWANKAVYISSFRVNQKDLFESAKRVTGTTDADWKIETVDTEERYKAAVAALQGGDRTGFSRMMYTRVFFPTGEGDNTRHGLANAALGLPEENIDESTKEGLRLHATGVLSY